MTTAQDPPVRNKQKRRRTKQLAEWRAKHPAPETKSTKAATTASPSGSASKTAKK